MSVKSIIKVWKAYKVKPTLLLLFFLFLSVTLSAQDHIVIVDKQSLTLRVYKSDGGKPLHTFPVAVGKGYGDKIGMGDMRTPEGVYLVEMVQIPRTWPFDYKDGRGVQYDIYGPLFFRLKTPPHRGIGIHGERDPLPELERGGYSMKLATRRDYSGVSKRRTHGCIVLRNEDLLVLRKYVKVDTPIIILPSDEDAAANAF